MNVHSTDGVSGIITTKIKKRSSNANNLPSSKKRKKKSNSYSTPELSTKSKYKPSFTSNTNGKYKSEPQSVHSNDTNDFVHEDKLSYVRSCYKEVRRQIKMQHADQIRSHLIASRDRVLELASKNKQETNVVNEIERLPSNSCKRTSSILTNLSCYRESNLYDNERSEIQTQQTFLHEAGNRIALDVDKIEHNCEDIPNKTRSMSKNMDHGITVKIRKKNGNQMQQNLKPSIFLEGVHKARPPHTTTVFLRSHFYTEDEQNLTYVPYFGDDDKEDVVSDVFDIDRRERMLKIGPEYREFHRNNLIDKVIKLLSKHKQLKKYFANADHENIVDNCDIYEMYKELAVILALDIDQIIDRHRIYFSNIKGKSQDDVGFTSKKKIEQNYICKEIESEKSKSSKYDDKCKSKTKVLEYEELMDSYRNLFCRRCFTYDCNFHGNLEKPNIELQGELAVLKEKEEYWQSVSSILIFF